MNHPTRPVRRCARRARVCIPLSLAGLLASTPSVWGAAGTYTNTVSGGLWSDTANWTGGIVADGATFTANLSSSPVGGGIIHFDSPRTLGGLTFTTTTGLTLDNNGSSANILTLDNGGSAPIVTTTTAGIVSTISTPLVSTTGLSKVGAGTLALSNASISGAVTVGATTANTSILRLETGSTVNATTVTVNGANGARNELRVSGGSLTVSGMATSAGVATAARSGQIIVDSGTVNLNGGWQSTADAGAALIVNGGTVNVASVEVKRNSGTSADFTSGFVVTGGTARVTGTVGIGTGNSFGAMSVEGGSLTVNGTVTVGNQSSAGRGGALRVTGGTFVATDTVDGLVVGKTNGVVGNQLATATFTNGVSTVEKVTFQYDATLAGTGTLAVNGGTLYVGSGGIVKKDAATGQAIAINVTGGTLGAKADWSSNLNVSTGSGTANNPNFKAADADNVAHNITLNGVISGNSGFTKTGAGTLTLGGINTYVGAATTVSAGRLNVTGSLAAATTVTIANDAILGGTGTANGSVILSSALALADAGTLQAGVSGSASGGLTIGGNLTLGDNSILLFSLDAANAHSTLFRTGGGTWTFDADQAFDFSNAQSGTYTNLISGLAGTEVGLDSIGTWRILTDGFTGSFNYNGVGGVNLVLSAAAIPEPATTAVLAGLGVLSLAFWRRRRA